MIKVGDTLSVDVLVPRAIYVPNGESGYSTRTLIPGMNVLVE